MVSVTHFLVLYSHLLHILNISSVLGCKLITFFQYLHVLICDAFQCKLLLTKRTNTVSQTQKACRVSYDLPGLYDETVIGGFDLCGPVLAVGSLDSTTLEAIIVGGRISRLESCE